MNYIVNEIANDKVKWYRRDIFELNCTNEDEFIEALIFIGNRKIKDFGYFTFVFKSADSNKLTGRTISRNLFWETTGGKFDKNKTIESIKKIITDLTTDKSVAGSDNSDLVDSELDLTVIAVTKNLIAKGEGKSDKILFKSELLEETKGPKGKGNKDCAKVCLDFIYKKLGIDDSVLVKTKPAKLTKLCDLTEFIKKNELPIGIYSNSFLLRKSLSDIFEGREIIEGDEVVKEREIVEIFIENKKKFLMRHQCVKLNFFDIESVKLYDSKLEEQYSIIYDEFNQHYDVIVGDLKLCEDVFIDYTCQVIKGDSIIFKPKEININNQKGGYVRREYIFFDYETVINFDKFNCMQEYSLSILRLDQEELDLLTDWDDAKNEEKIQALRKTNCVTFLGFDCSNKFIDWIIKNQGDTAFVFIGFNNSSFDNFILLDALLTNKNIGIGHTISDIFYNGSQLLNFHMNGRHNTFDIRKHLMGSLKDNCKSFKIQCCAKKSFDHNKAQQLFLNGELIDFIEDNEELKEYNEYDVLATAVLFNKYKQALSKIEATKDFAFEIDSIKTIGSLIYKVFEKSKKEKNFKLPKLDIKKYTDLQKYKIAGRVELFNGVQKVEERLVSTDVCSLYPYVMSVAPVHYPCGDIVDTDEYQGDDTIGFYYCDIDQSNLAANNLPNIYAKKSAIENDWSTKEILDDYLISNVTIGLLKKFGCKVDIKSGFYFTEKKKSCEMFDFLLSCMNAKNEQDMLKGSPDYNPALRETLKLLMNALSGKVIEGLHTEKTEDVETLADFQKIAENSKSINCINTIGGKIFVSYEVDAEKLLAKQRPIYIGVLIYDYAKRYMYENSYSKVGRDQLLYTDTDASKFRYSRFLEWKKEIDENNLIVPHWEEVESYDARYKTHKIYQSGSKVFGSFEDELEESTGEKYTFYCVEKKSWCYTVDGKSKFKFKGLNGKAILSDLSEDFIKKTEVNKQNGGVEVKYCINPDKKLDVYNYCESNKDKSIENSGADKFFERLYTERSAYVICTSFRKIVKNSKRSVGVGETERHNQLMNKIQVNHALKKISLK
jgi:hypothetical protein